MGLEPLILIANPGSASRKYALYNGTSLLLKLHFEHDGGQIVYSAENNEGISPAQPASISHLAFAASKVLKIIDQRLNLEFPEDISNIALRVVAPSTFFQEDRLLDKAVLDKLTRLEPRALLHINATLQEAHQLRIFFPQARLAGISDSAFHSTKPAYAQNYGLPLDVQDKLDIRRFGYHGISVESVVGQLRQADKLPKRLIVCHLGSGASVTAVRNGKSIDTSMGYSPLEGLIMATRSGSIDVTAAQVLQTELGLDSQGLQDYLNNKGGLLGLSGKSPDIRELIQLDNQADKRAGLALDTYVNRVQQAIGAMASTLGGVDSLVFTGTVGERSAHIRRRILKKLLFLGLSLDSHVNHHQRQPSKITLLSPGSHPAKVYIVPSDEDSVMVARARKLIPKDPS